MKGIILAGGTGSRLWPITISVCKQLLPIYNKPLIYYPISILMQAGIREILIITTPHDQESFKMLLGDGSAFGINFTYATQNSPEGIAQAFIIAKDFIADDKVSLILGDNLFYGVSLEKELLTNLHNKGSRIFTYTVSDPTEYGVLNLDELGNPISVEEKPSEPKSDFAITGLYFFDAKVIQYAQSIRPSRRGELEITEIIQLYIDNQDLEFVKLSSGITWLDTGSPKSLSDASQFVRVIEERTGKNIACLEEIAYKNNWIDDDMLSQRIEFLKNCSYGSYLKKVLKASKT